jgi:redox-sensitive bicupin YhaK (pirin superfamily)
MKNSGSSIIKGHHKKSYDVREFIDGSERSCIFLRSCAVGLGTYKPGWRWSTHAGAQTGKSSENHIGYIISGNMVIRDSFGIEAEVGPGEAFEVGPGHDAWVAGCEPCVALDFIPIVP